MKDPKPNIVIVEDDSSFRRGLIRLFENENCSVDGFEDADSALKAIHGNRPDFVVCDYKLPGMNGLDFLRQLRIEKVDSPFVLVTAHFTEDLQAEAREEGALDAISKPLDISGLRDLIRTELKLS